MRGVRTHQAWPTSSSEGARTYDCGQYSPYSNSNPTYGQLGGCLHYGLLVVSLRAFKGAHLSPTPRELLDVSAFTL